MWIFVTERIGGTPRSGEREVKNYVNTDMVERVHLSGYGGITIHFQSGQMFDFMEDMAWWNENVVSKGV